MTDLAPELSQPTGLGTVLFIFSFSAVRHSVTPSVVRDTQTIRTLELE